MPNGRSGGFRIRRDQLRELVEELPRSTPLGDIEDGALTTTDLLLLINQHREPEVIVEEQDHAFYIIHLARWTTIDESSPLYPRLRLFHGEPALGSPKRPAPATPSRTLSPTRPTAQPIRRPEARTPVRAPEAGPRAYYIQLAVVALTGGIAGWIVHGLMSAHFVWWVLPLMCILGWVMNGNPGTLFEALMLLLILGALTALVVFVVGRHTRILNPWVVGAYACIAVSQIEGAIIESVRKDRW